MASTLGALAYRLSKRAGVGPSGSARWFDLTLGAVSELASSLGRLATKLDEARSTPEIAASLTNAGAALSRLLGHAREYRVPHSHKPHRRLWLFEVAPAIPVDLNPSEVRWALDDTNRALAQLARR